MEIKVINDGDRYFRFESLADDETALYEYVDGLFSPSSRFLTYFNGRLYIRKDICSLITYNEDIMKTYNDIVELVKNDANNNEIIKKMLAIIEYRDHTFDRVYDTCLLD